MLNAIRKIRKQLIDDTKISKYLAYALGEILLVVIGILLALQINNWNESNKTEELAKSFLVDIKEDLANDTMTFNAAIERVSNTIANNKRLLNPEVVQDHSIDSLLSLLLQSFHSTRIYQIDNATYLKLSNTGFLESGLFKELFADINTYYNKEYVTYSEFIEWDEESTIDIMHPDFLGSYKTLLDISSLISNTNSSIGQEREKAVVVIKEFLNSVEFRNKTWANYTRKELVIERLTLQKQLATHLIHKINRELL